MLGQVAGRFGLGLLREESKAAQSKASYCLFAIFWNLQ
jgi:hypothetical protein